MGKNKKPLTKRTQKIAIGLMVLFFLLSAGTAINEVRDYYAFRDSEIIQGEVTDLDDSRAGRKRRYSMDVTVMVHGESMVLDRVPIPRRTLRINGLAVSRSRVAVGDVVSVVAIPDGETYRIALADDVLHVWKDLPILIIVMLTMIGAMVLTAKQKPLS